VILSEVTFCDRPWRDVKIQELTSYNQSLNPLLFLSVAVKPLGFYITVAMCGGGGCARARARVCVCVCVCANARAWASFRARLRVCVRDEYFVVWLIVAWIARNPLRLSFCACGVWTCLCSFKFCAELPLYSYNYEAEIRTLKNISLLLLINLIVSISYNYGMIYTWMYIYTIQSYLSIWIHSPTLPVHL